MLDRAKKTKDEVSQAVEWYAVLVFGIVIGSMFAIAVLGSGELARLLALLGGF